MKSIPENLIAFIAVLMFIVALTAFPGGDKAQANKSCIENGGYVKEYQHYTTCSQDKPGYEKGVKK